MLTKQQFSSFRSDVNTALKEVATKYGITLSAGSIKYGTNEFTCRLEGKRKEVDGKPFEQAEFEKYAKLYGFEPTDFGRCFTSGGKRYKIVSLKTKNRSYPIIAKNVGTGTSYKFAAEDVLRALA